MGILEISWRNKNMPDIKLIEPTLDYEDDIWRFRQEIIDSDDTDKFAGCGNLEECSSVKEWIDTIRVESNIELCPKDKVPSTIYIAVRLHDNKIVGIIDLRYHINHPILSTWGGHMGYYVRSCERRNGYATEMLRKNLLNCNRLGIEKVLITCGASNYASEKAIVANGGVFEKQIEVDGEIIKRFWITIKYKDTYI
ncbi:GNAT family N-acetyltransferase [Anaerosporobacter faecicola]|uniref:GNAT family N-acetyltransferase n=1 Tax=Anaerosporobacter faecicola TaxID=2718714 RepID=UPI001EE4ED60|nr:GNAT family N-acetyltransferase [Anaerosporobacter faecicola]